MPPVEGKVAIVTGASSGIGEAIVKELVAAGMIVAGLARRVERVEELAKSLESQKGSLSAVKCDVTNEEDIKAAFQWVEQNLGPPTALINNAGLSTGGLISEMNLEKFRVMFDTNVIGLSLCTREALKSMIANKTEGTIININSIVGHEILPAPSSQGYSSTKFAVTALSEGLRNEITQLGANIRVTSLSPGAVESEFSVKLRSSQDNATIYSIIGRLPATDVADCALFVLQSPQRMTIRELQVLPTKQTILSQAIGTAKLMAKNN